MYLKKTYLDDPQTYNQVFVGSSELEDPITGEIRILEVTVGLVGDEDIIDRVDYYYAVDNIDISYDNLVNWFGVDQVNHAIVLAGHEIWDEDDRGYTYV